MKMKSSVRSRSTSASSSRGMVTHTASFTQSQKRALSSKKSSGSFVPHDYQKEGIRFVISRPTAGLFLKPGFGKTAVMLHAFKLLRSKGYARRWVIVGTRRIIHRVWGREVQKWGLDIKVGIAHGPRKDEVLRDESNEIVLVTYDCWKWLLPALKQIKKERRIKLKERGKLFDGIVFDESTKLKNWGAQRTKRWRSLLDEFTRRYILTGSPAPNGLMNLFAQIWLLDGGERLGRYITAFRNEYFYPTGYMGYEYKLQDDAEDRMFDAISDIIFRVSPDKLKLPPLTFVDRRVKLEGDARKAYDRMEQDFILRLEEGVITAVNAGVKTQKMRQIANGAVYLDGRERKWKTLHDEKLDELEDLIDEFTGDPALVAVEFKHDVERIRARLGKDIPYIGSGLSDKKADAIIDEFNEGSVPVLLANPASVAHGLNMQGYARNVVFFALDWNLENYEQFVQRLHRQGQKRPVVVYRIIAEDTVDEDIVQSTGAKDRTQQRALAAFEERYRRRQADSTVLRARGPHDVREKRDSRMGR